MFAGVGVVARGREHHIQRQTESLVEHLRENAREQGAWDLEAWVGVDFYEPGLEGIVDHEVEPEDLKIVLEALGGELKIGALDSIQADGLHLGEHLRLEVVVLLRVSHIEIPLELSIGDFIGRLVTAIEGAMLLNRIVCQMDLPLEVLDVELVGGSSDVAFLEPVGSHQAVDVCDQQKMADVELTPLVEHRPIQVQLHNESLLSPVLMFALLLHNLVELIYLVDDCDPIASVSEFSRLHDPDIAHFAASLLVGLLHAGLPAFVVGDESLVLDIFKPFLDVEGEGYFSESVFPNELVVLLQIVEQGFFVSQIEVVAQVVVNPKPFVLQLRKLQEGPPILVGLALQLSPKSPNLTVVILHHNLVVHLLLQGLSFFFYALALPPRREPLAGLGCDAHNRFLSPELGGVLDPQGRGLLLVEKVHILELSPDEVDVEGFLIADRPPKAPLEQPLDQLPIVTQSHPRLILLLALPYITLLQILLSFDVEAVNKLQFEDELFVAVDPIVVDWVLEVLASSLLILALAASGLLLGAERVPPAHYILHLHVSMAHAHSPACELICGFAVDGALQNSPIISQTRVVIIHEAIDNIFYSLLPLLLAVTHFLDLQSQQVHVIEADFPLLFIEGAQEVLELASLHDCSHLDGPGLGDEFVDGGETEGAFLVGILHGSGVALGRGCPASVLLLLDASVDVVEELFVFFVVGSRFVVPIISRHALTNFIDSYYNLLQPTRLDRTDSPPLAESKPNNLIINTHIPIKPSNMNDFVPLFHSSYIPTIRQVPSLVVSHRITLCLSSRPCSFAFAIIYIQSKARSQLIDSL